MTKIIAVICNDIDDFKSWWKNRGFVCAHPSNGKLFVGDDVYRGVYKPEHLCSFLLDDIIETAAAVQNPYYSLIKEHAMANLKELPQVKNSKPPAGIIPRYLHNENRFSELRDVIKNYANDYHYIDPEWIIEYNELLDKLQIRKHKINS